MNRLVTSTSALIGRKPIARSRSCNQRGDGPLRRPRSARPSTKVQARGSAISHRTGEAKAAGTGAGAKGFKRPSPAAAKSRATPRTDSASPRFGVTPISITGSSSPAQAA